MRYLVHDLLEESALRAPESEALVFGTQRFDYAELARRVGSLAGGLRGLGLEPGDRVGIYLAPSATLAAAIFAVSRAGGVFVPIHHGLFPEQVAHILGDSGARALLTDGTRWSALASAGAVPPGLAFAVVEDSAPAVPACPVHDLAALLDGAPPRRARAPGIGRDLAAIIYTSGSTGRPKGVMLSHTNVLAGAEIVSDYLGITARDRLLAALPFSFDAGLNQLMTAVLNGGTTVLIHFRFGRDIVQMLARERITGLAGVPSLWRLVVDARSGLDKASLPGLRYVTNTGGAMPPNVLARLRALLPETQIFLMYGLTEAFRSTYLPPEQLDRRPGSIGKAIPNTEILVVDDEGRPCAPGQVGELVHRGPTVSLGYWNCPELTERVLRPHPHPPPGAGVPERVCYSGDLVRRDEDGFLYFVGRRDNQIKSAGFRISPTEVEDVVCRHPAVRQSAVVGVPDDVLGQCLVAFAVAEEPPDPADILSTCASYLPRHMIPRHIELVDALPLTPSGKVDYPALRRLATPADAAAAAGP